MSHKIKWNGEILSVRNICKREGISEYAVYKRISLTGEDPEVVLLYYINQPNRGNKDREKIELNGQLLNVKDYCRKLSYDYRLVTRYKTSQPNKSYKEILNEWENLSQDDIINSVCLYDIWHSIMQRCYNPKYSSYKYYGGKKINPTKVCVKWQNYLGFREDNWKEYTKHVEKYGRKQTSIDRIDWNGNYEPANCEWTDWEQQGKNKSNTEYILNTGETLSHCCTVNNYPYNAIYNYIKKYNLTPDEALTIYLSKIK